MDCEAHGLSNAGNAIPSSGAQSCSSVEAASARNRVVLTSMTLLDRNPVDSQPLAPLAAHTLLPQILGALEQRAYWKDAEGLVRGYNRAFAVEHGLPELDNTSCCLTEVGDLLGTRTDLDSDAEVLASRSCERPTEHAWVNRDGDTRHLRWRKSPLLDASGRPVGILGVYEDVTRQRESERRLTRMSRAVESAAESIFITDLHGTIESVNPAFSAITGYSAEEALGSNPRLVKSGVHDQAFYKAIWETLDGGEAWSGHVTNRRKDGRLYRAQLTIAPIFGTEGVREGYVGVQRDATEELNALDELRAHGVELSIRNNFGAAIREAESIDALVDRVLAAWLHLPGFHPGSAVAAVFVWDDEAQRFRVHRSLGSAPDGGVAMREELPREAASSAAVHVPCASIIRSGWLANPEQADLLSDYSFTCVPLKAGASAVGMVQTYAKRNAGALPVRLQVLETIGNHVGMAIRQHLDRQQIDMARAIASQHLSARVALLEHMGHELQASLSSFLNMSNSLLRLDLPHSQRQCAVEALRQARSLQSLAVKLSNWDQGSSGEATQGGTPRTQRSSRDANTRRRASRP